MPVLPCFTVVLSLLFPGIPGLFLGFLLIMCSSLGLYPRVLTEREKPLIYTFSREKRGVDKRGGPCAHVLSVAGFYAILRCFLGDQRFILRGFSLLHTLGF